ncbi:MAG: hypothetical protein GY725_06025, partial [bacterium]|nr:hypothetical protein [bacterium]
MRAELARDVARRSQDHTAPWPGFPTNSVQWVDWMEKNEDVFRQELAAVRKGQHRAVNIRAQAPRNYEAAPRLEALRGARSPQPPWLRLISDGFYTLWRPELHERTLLFARSVMR